jgi:hypothetical protein
MGLHQIKMLLHVEGNSYQNQEANHGMGEHLQLSLTDKELISRIYRSTEN